MKYFRIFNHTEDYLEYMATETAIVPNISYCSGDVRTYITPSDVPPPPHVDVTGVTINVTATTINVGSSLALVASVLPSNATDKTVTWSSDDTSIATVTTGGVVTAIANGAANITVTTHDGGYTASCAVTAEIPSVTTLVIEGAASISAETCMYNAIADNVEDVSSSATWSITSGSQYATINSSNGHVTILNGASESTVTIQAVYGGLTATKTVTLTYLSGASSETETESTTDISGNTTTITTTVTEYEDGSSSEVSETIITDVNGNTIGTVESTKETNADGSYSGSTTNYDEDGKPTNGNNVSGDTDGNVSTQSLEYDDSGNTVVVGYDIDTSESTGKTFNGDGANTEYYAFDVTHGFELEFHFTVDCSNSPTGQNQNHHNILTAKRASPEPWYGFQLRQSSTNKSIQLGTQFNTGSNTNTTIQPASITGNTAEYDLKITYDPTLTANTFVCRDMINNTNVYVNDGVFPDIPELKYLKIVIGYAVDENNNPYRFANINVFNFTLRRLSHVETPIISCVENEVSITCETVGGNIYYRLNETGEYSAYTSSFEITADTIVEAYVEVGGDRSATVKQTCYYDRVEPPVIECTGKLVKITCEEVGADIYYRLNESGTYSAYTSIFSITANTVVEAYSSVDSKTSIITKETCEYTSGDYFTIKSLANNNSITLKNNLSASTATNFYSSTDSGFTWTSFTIAKGATANVATINSGDTVIIRGINTTLGNEYNYGHFFRATGNYEVYGNVMSLITNSKTNMDFSTGATFCFAQLFSGSTNLVNAENLIINPTSMLVGAFNGMFRGCTALVKAPELPCPYTNNQCYSSMFEGCTALSQPPSTLSATSFTNNCYQRMFCMNRDGKSSAAMTYTPKMYGTITSSVAFAPQMFCGNGSLETVECYWTYTNSISQSNMMNYTNSTGTFKKRSTQSFASGVNGIPTGWTVVDDDIS